MWQVQRDGTPAKELPKELQDGHQGHQKEGEDESDSKGKSKNNARYSWSYLRVSQDRVYATDLRKSKDGMKARNTTGSEDGMHARRQKSSEKPEVASQGKCGDCRVAFNDAVHVRGKAVKIEKCQKCFDRSCRCSKCRKLGHRLRNCQGGKPGLQDESYYRGG